jgi:hypothetical protein
MVVAANFRLSSSTTGPDDSEVATAGDDATTADVTAVEGCASGLPDAPRPAGSTAANAISFPAET